ncbi:hypothetical protein B488_13700 [Liberibacter crescens BT-1]|uniref:Tim44-like domain-containing protein n=1 Tax=Liberibacter crescens (strain BT-1) TaxID=1215343 RepID=L0EWM3_LIBCB|nr:Tim44/TimA family putative adaptor protein [Liberibacter crescens]AGA65362.1 hypothetical protein B488_13700 [Liberibacter crescens BT-1]AMC12300.1 hypothetical protein RL73_00140 [Liberibacter crescens]
MNLSDFITFFFLIVTILLFIQLRSFLGKRTGNEKPPADIFSIHEELSKVSKKDKKLVVSSINKEENFNNFSYIDAVSPIGSELNNSLRKVISVYPHFNPEDFIKGVRVAYEMIVVAFYERDLSEVKDLLFKEVYDNFVLSISERKNKKDNKNIKSSLIGTDSVKILDAKIVNDNIMITCRIVGQIISASYDQEGLLLKKEPEITGKVVDIWTFARKISSSNPNWKLISTESEN